MIINISGSVALLLAYRGWNTQDKLWMLFPEWVPPSMTESNLHFFAIQYSLHQSNKFYLKTGISNLAKTWLPHSFEMFNTLSVHSLIQDELVHSLGHLKTLQKHKQPHSPCCCILRKIWLLHMHPIIDHVITVRN